MRGALPLAFGGGDELVDDDLRTVHEVAKLGFPANEQVAGEQRIPVVEAQNRGFGEERVVHAVATLLGLQIVQGDVAITRLRIIKHAVTMAEGAATHVLAAEADAVAFREQGAKGQGLSVGPIEAFTSFDGLLASGEEAFRDGGMQIEALRHFEQALGHDFELLRFHAGFHRGVVIGRLRHGHAAFEWIAAIGALVLLGERGDAGFEFVIELALQRGGTRFVEQALAGEIETEERRGGRMLRDAAGHVRLREAGLVGFVVTVTAVANDVDDDIAAKGLAELQSELRSADDLHRAIAIHMEDGRFDHLRHVGAVVGRTGVLRHRGEADLVVHDEVDRAAGAVTGKLREIQHLSDETLASESRVTMNEHRDDFLAVLCIAQRTLTGSRHAFHHGIDGFQVARIRSEHHADGITAAGLAHGFKAEVIFHIAITADHVRHVVLAELVKEILQRLAQEIRQHTEAATVGHAEHDFFAAVGWHAFEHGLQRHEQGLATFHGETLLPHETTMQEAFERLRLQQPAQCIHLLLRGWFRCFGHLDAVQQPSADFGVIDMPELKAGLATIYTA